MDEKRTERFTVGLTPAVLAKLDAYAADHRWSRSTAIAELIQRLPLSVQRAGNGGQ